MTKQIDKKETKSGRKHLRTAALPVMTEDDKAIEFLKKEQGIKSDAEVLRFAIHLSKAYLTQAEANFKKNEEVEARLAALEENQKATNWKVNQMYLLQLEVARHFGIVKE